MSIWTRIGETLQALAKGEGLSALFYRLRPPPERSVAFTIAVIALGAKMAKADGQVTRDEVDAFREVFRIEPGEEANAAWVFDLARQDVAGFETYALRIGRMLGADTPLLRDLMEGLFHIALADGEYHPKEDRFLRLVAGFLGLSEPQFRGIRARFVDGEDPDPREVLGVGPDAGLDEVRAAWREQVLECHPDRMAARGVPEEAMRLAERRLVALNRAWEDIRNSCGH